MWIEVILRYFEHNHLPERLQQTVIPFRSLAYALAERYERDGGDWIQLYGALEDLLTAKDKAVRAFLKEPS
jgi:hypothetical protein